MASTLYKPASVLGFAFWGGRVLLMKKARPDWQAGRINGVGGKCKPGEHHDSAMVREFNEETGLHVPTASWHNYAVLDEFDHVVYVYATDLTAQQFRAARNEDKTEPLVNASVFGLADWAGAIIPNLMYLIPLALDGGVECVTFRCKPGKAHK